LSLWFFFNWAPRHEGVLGEWSYSSTHSLTSALDGGELSASSRGRFTSRERVPGTHWIGWVGPEPFWTRWWRETFPPPAGSRLLNPDRPALSLIPIKSHNSNQYWGLCLFILCLIWHDNTYLIVSILYITVILWADLSCVLYETYMLCCFVTFTCYYYRGLDYRMITEVSYVNWSDLISIKNCLSQTFSTQVCLTSG
jgi:hypothetical protein